MKSRRVGQGVDVALIWAEIPKVSATVSLSRQYNTYH